MTPTWLFRIPHLNDELIDETDNLEQVCSIPKKYLPSISIQMQDLPIETAASAMDPDPEQTDKTVEFFGQKRDNTQPLIAGLFSFGLTFLKDCQEIIIVPASSHPGMVSCSYGHVRYYSVFDTPSEIQEQPYDE